VRGKVRVPGLSTGASPTARFSTADLRLSTMTLWEWRQSITGVLVARQEVFHGL